MKCLKRLKGQILGVRSSKGQKGPKHLIVRNFISKHWSKGILLISLIFMELWSIKWPHIFNLQTVIRTPNPNLHTRAPLIVIRSGLKVLELGIILDFQWYCFFFVFFFKDFVKKFCQVILEIFVKKSPTVLNTAESMVWQSTGGKWWLTHWASLLRWIWSISEYNLWLGTPRKGHLWVDHVSGNIEGVDLQNKSQSTAHVDP